MFKLYSLIISILLYIPLNAQTIANYSNQDGLLDNFINSITVDIYDNIWMGTIAGICVFDPVNDTWTSWDTEAIGTNFPSSNIKIIKAMSNGYIWMGTDFGASRFDGENWETFTNLNGLNNNQVKSIDEDQDGGVWIGTMVGVSHFDSDNWMSYGSDDLHWSGVNGTSFDSQGNIWFSSPLGGITKFDGNLFTTFSTYDNLLSMNSTDIVIDNQDNKWIGSSNGMSVLNSEENNFTHHTQMYYLPPPDTLNPVVQIAMDSEDNVWAAIYVGYLAVGGIAYLNESEWVSIGVEDGLAGPNIKGIAIDSQDNVWVATSTGLSKIFAMSSSLNRPTINNKFIVKTIDILGRETNSKGFNIEIYNDGSVEKKYKFQQ